MVSPRARSWPGRREWEELVIVGRHDLGVAVDADEGGDPCLVKLLIDHGYEGSLHFDAHAYRSEDYEGVKDFARGCIRSYMILKDKAARWNKDADIQALLKQINREDPETAKLTKKFSPQNAKKLLEFPLDRVSLANEPLPYEKLDQLTTEVLMGAR